MNIVNIEQNMKANNMNSPWLSVPAEFTPEICPVKIWPVKPLLGEKIVVFSTSPKYITWFNSPRGKCWIIDIPRWISELHPDKFGYHPVDIAKAVHGAW